MGKIGILGTVHDHNMREKFGYSLEYMESLIKEFKPDIICGEVRPEDWKRYCEESGYDGYLGPNEYRSTIIPLCEKEGIQFTPVDWFTEELIKMDYFEGKTESEKESLEKEFAGIIEEYMDIGKRSIIPFNSEKFNELIEKKQDFQNSINPSVHEVYWIKRNEIMIDGIERILEKNKDKRILCTVGVEHSYYYLNKLQENGYEVVYPLNSVKR